MNPVEKTMETSWKEVFEELRLKNEIGQPFSEILSSLVKKKYTLCGPLLALLPCFYRNVLKSQIRIYGEVMFEGEHTKGMLALNWLRL